MNEEYKLSVAFCATNESETLKNTYFKIRQYDSASEYIFILSDEASESCIDTVKDICSTENNCRYIFQNKPGLGNAIMNAFDEAQGTHIIVWPADDGMDTNAFPEMIRLSRENPEKIISVSRWLTKNGFEGYGALRKMINYISQRIFALLYKSSLTDFTNPTQIAPLNIYRNINWKGESWDFIPEMTFKPLKLGCDFIEVPCKNLSRKEGKSNSDIIKLSRYYFIILKIYFMSKNELTKRSYK